MVYRDHTFDIENMQCTMRHLFLDLSRNDGENGSIAGSGNRRVSGNIDLPQLWRKGALRAELQGKEGEQQQQQIYWSQRQAEEQGDFQGEDRIQG